MPVITGRAAVAEVYNQAKRRRWIVPTFCTENQTTVEAVLAAVQQKAAELGVRVPITIGITGQYLHRSQSTRYTHGRNPLTGRLMFLRDCEVLARPGGDYPDVDVITHFDHGQIQYDGDVLDGNLEGFSSVMFDQSEVPWEQNIRSTAQFVRTYGDRVYVEGAADEVADADTGELRGLTTPERAREFLDATGVDMVVANLGTEHRASVQDRRYHPEAARAISAIIGPRLVLHGASSVAPAQLDTLFDDGVCKVNIWTTLERDSAPVLMRDLLENADLVAGAELAQRLQNEGLLGASAPTTRRPDMDYFATTHRQDIVFDVMRHIVKGYLDRWYRTGALDQAGEEGYEREAPR